MVEAAGTGAAVEPITIRGGMPPPSPPPTTPDPTAMAIDPATATAPAGSEAQDPLTDAGRPAESGPFSPLGLEVRQNNAPPLEPPAPPTSAPGRPLPHDSPELAFAPVAVVAALTRDTPELAGRSPR